MKQYVTAIKQWLQFCFKKNLDSFDFEEKIVIEFLTTAFQKGASYGTLNSARSALAFVSSDISDNKHISRLLKGVARLRPPKPKYEQIWNVDPVFEELAKWYPLESLDLDQLTERLILLLALGTAQRVQTISSIKLSNLKHDSLGYKIKITDLIKTSRPGVCQPLLNVPYLKDKPQLCIASTLDRYIEVTKPLRKEENCLFIVTRSPFKSAKIDTVRRWLRTALTKCGVDQEYTAHSTRHASTSAAMKKGVDINLIKKAAGWSKESQVFFKHYNRVIEPKEKSFALELMS